MSNFEKANKLARKWIDSMGGLSNINHIYGDDVGVLIYTLRDAGLLAPDTPELAQALAEEAWEYSYQVQNTGGMWEHPTPWPGDPERWWETKEEAEEVAIEAHACGYPTRIVRRRISAPEVINE